MAGFFSVKGFEKFQHYKDRSPPWIKLYNELLDDYAFGQLPDASKMHLVAIWLLASRYNNSVPYDAEWISRRINATEPVDLHCLALAGFILPNQDCSAMLAERKQDACLEVEGETEGETEPPCNPPSRGELSVPIEQSVNAWNDLADELGLPSVRMPLSKTRRRKLVARLNEIGGTDGWEQALAKIRASPLCRGENERGWTATLDFMLSQSSMTKLLEGNYDDRRKANGDVDMTAVWRELDDEYRSESAGERDHSEADDDTVRPAAPH